MQDIIKFNAENGKGITVVGEETPWDGGAYRRTFNAKMGGGDIDCATEATSTPLFVNNDLLADLTPLWTAGMKKYYIDENIYSIMKEAGGTDRLYAVPWNIQCYVYYRPSIFEAAGVYVQRPTKNSNCTKSAPWTPTATARPMSTALA